MLARKGKSSVRPRFLFTLLVIALLMLFVSSCAPKEKEPSPGEEAAERLPTEEPTKISEAAPTKAPTKTPKPTLKPTATPKPSPTPTEIPCAEESQDFINALEALFDDWDDANAVAGSTARLSLSAPVKDLQAIRRAVADLDAPACAEHIKPLCRAYMDHVIDGYLAFMREEPDSVVEAHGAQANEGLIVFTMGLTELKTGITLPTRTPTLEPTEEPEEELAFVDSTRGLSHLDSYRSRTVMSWEEEDGEKGDIEMLVEFVREPPAQRMVMTGLGDEEEEAGEIEIITIGDTSYMRFGDEWMAMSAQEESIADLGEIWSAGDFLGGGRGKYVGRETVNGVATKHYRYEKGAFRLDTELSSIKEGHADVWLSTKYDVYVRVILHMEGEDEDGNEVAFDMESNLTDINEPITIKPPERVEKPGLPEDIPLIDGATEVSAIGGMVTFEVKKSMEDVVEFYEEEMKANGWEMDEPVIPGMLDFSKDGRTAGFMIVEEEDLTGVIIFLEEESE